MNSSSNLPHPRQTKGASYFFDKRVKLLPCHKLKIKQMYNDGFGIARLAFAFRVSDTLILSIVNDAFALSQKAAFRGYMAYYDKDIHTRRVKAYRQRKRAFARLIDPSLPRYKRKKKNYSCPKEFERHQTSLCVVGDGINYRIHSTYTKRSASINAKKRGIVPEDAIITTWGKLRAYIRTYPEKAKMFNTVLTYPTLQTIK